VVGLLALDTWRRRLGGFVFLNIVMAFFAAQMVPGLVVWP
jgi:hypothetical protein